MNEFYLQIKYIFAPKMFETVFVYFIDMSRISVFHLLVYQIRVHSNDDRMIL